MIDWLRPYCMSFPHATESIQWGDHLVFKVGGKVFAITSFEPVQYVLTIKCAPEKFNDFVERPGIAPAPYLARAKWIAFESEDALSHTELKSMIRESYDLVCAKLPKKARAAFELKKETKPISRPASSRAKADSKTRSTASSVGNDQRSRDRAGASSPRKARGSRRKSNPSS